ncbi:MAG TPA: winged helix-turn-helix domain-containing protein [Streptosporangiaceae bacterium]|nr:winged helix-turn-helix domain-containing protein [Streptosporangiaceae bacterium]
MPREAVPPYKRVADIIAGKITSGELVRGDQVPSMVRLADEYGISRGTARRVLVDLRERDLVEITPGWGTFVK